MSTVIENTFIDNCTAVAPSQPVGVVREEILTVTKDNDSED